MMVLAGNPVQERGKVERKGSSFFERVVCVDACVHQNGTAREERQSEGSKLMFFSASSRCAELLCRMGVCCGQWFELVNPIVRVRW
jgi:hypothetical protein